MRTRQLIIVGQDRLREHEVRERVALFSPNGEPLLIGGESKDYDLQKQISALKGRTTKLENRVKELEGE